MSRPARALQWDEMQTMKRYCEEQGRYRDLMLVLIPGSTAFRHSDWGALRWKDVLGKELRVTEQKTSKKRTVPLVEEVQEQVRQTFQTLQLMQPPSKRPDFLYEPVFVNHQHGRPLTRAGVKHALENLARQTGIPLPVSSHSLRKAWAIRMYEIMGADFTALLAVSRWLNHSSAATTLAYLGFEAKERDLAMQKMWK